MSDSSGHSQSTDGAAKAGQFTLHVRAETAPLALEVVAFEGREDLTGLYSFDLRIVTLAPLSPASLGERATLALHPTTGQSRLVTGILASVSEIAAPSTDGSHVYRARLVPRAWRLKRRTRSKVFQDKTVAEIIALVASAAEIPCEARLLRAHTRRAYCVQYEETDYAFIRRIAGEEGLFWFFEPTDRDHAASAELAGGEKLVVVDAGERAPSIHAANDEALRVRSGSTAESPEDDVSSFRLRQSLRPRTLLLRDYDFQRPLFDLRCELTESGAAPRGPADPGPTSRAKEESTADGLFVYDHRGDYAAPDVCDERAQVELEQHRARASVAFGESTCLAMRCGYRFRLEAEASAASSGEYIVTEVRHHGLASDRAGREPTYSNRFECVPATVHPRPKRPQRRLHNVAASAVVVGPRGQEIHTDEFGRVKIQFHWDLDGKNDDHSSIWVRVLQAWAGTGWGSQFVPRVGMEVLVSFLHGDHDCPVVVGCLPNRTHPLPFPLPQDKTRSGLRTQSSPGGNGFNELSFDDAALKERIFIHAQRDLEEVVQNDRRRTVGANEELEIKGRQLQKIGGRADHIVAGDRGSRVQGNLTDEVHGLRTVVDGAVAQSVARDLDLRVQGVHTTEVGDRRSEVRGKEVRTTRGDTVEHTFGSRALVVGESGAPKSLVVHVEGTSTSSASDELILESAKAITLRVGTTSVRISEHGVELNGPAISATAKGATITAGEQGLSLSSRSVADLSADRILIHTTHEDAILAMQKEVKVSGHQILLNSPEDATDPRPPDPPAKTIIQLVDQEGAPIAKQSFVLRLDDKSERSGVLDDNGRIELVLDPEPTTATIVFPDLPEPRPDLSKSMVAHAVRPGEYLEKIAARVGLEAKTLWKHPKNADLAKKRANPALLSSGDVIWVPAKKPHQPQPIQCGSSNRLERPVPRVPVKVHLARADGTPLVDEEIEVKSIGLKAKTGQDGLLEIEVPVHARQVEVWIPSLGLVQPIMVGDLDPVDTPAGLLQRLENMGYGNYFGFRDEPADAIRAFQRDRGLEITGIADEALKKALAAAHDHTDAGG